MAEHSSYVANTQDPGRQSAVRKLGAGDCLTPVHEVRNPSNPWAVQLWDKRGQLVGYVPTSDAEWLARMLDEGKAPKVQVTGVRSEGESWSKRFLVTTVILTENETEKS